MTEVVESFADQISSKWRESCERILETAHLILDARRQLSERQFLDLVTKLPMTQSTVQKLLAIANRSSLSKTLGYLPPHWTTIYEISQLSDEQIQHAIQVGIIHPSAERAEIIKYRNSLALDEFDKKEKIEGGGYQLGSISIPETFDLSKSVALEKELEAVLGKYGVILKHDKSKNGVIAIRRKQLAAEMEEWLGERAKTYNTLCLDDDQIQLFEDAFAQICGGLKYHAQSDGSFGVNDVRSSQNPYNGWTRKELFDYAKKYKILSRWTRIREIDKLAWIKQLIKTHCEGTAQHRADAKKKLIRLATRGGHETKSEAQRALELLIEA